MKRYTRILVNFSFGLTLFSTAGLSAKLIDRTVVTVNEDVILESDVDKFIQKARLKSFQELFGGIDDKTLADRNKVLQLLVEEKIIDQQVKKLDLGASSVEVDGQIKAITKRNNITVAQLTERLKQLGTSMEDYRTGLKRQIERRNLVDREIKPTLEVSEEQLRHFYLRSKKPDAADQVFKIAQIFIENGDKGGITAAERAKKIHGEAAKAPGDFEKLAKEYSDDASTAAQGGSLGDLPLSTLSKEFRAVVPKTPAGQITQPIQTKAGFHILKVLEVKSADYSTLSKEQKEAIRGQMLGQEVEKKMALWLERKKNEAHIRITEPIPASKPQK